MPTFYRVVSVAEWDDIVASSKLRAGRNTMEGKHLWSTVEHAAQFRDWLISEKLESECILISVDVPRAAAKRFAVLEGLDRIGTGFFAELADLVHAVVRRVDE